MCLATSQVTRVNLNRRSNCTLGPWVRPPDRHIFDKKCGLLRPLSTDTRAPSYRQKRGANTSRYKATKELHICTCKSATHLQFFACNFLQNTCSALLQRAPRSPLALCLLPTSRPRSVWLLKKTCPDCAETSGGHC